MFSDDRRKHRSYKPCIVFLVLFQEPPTLQLAEHDGVLHIVDLFHIHFFLLRYNLFTTGVFFKAGKIFSNFHNKQLHTYQ